MKDASSWWQRAACRGNPEPFFGPDDERPDTRASRETVAKAVCAGCPVRLRCGLYAMASFTKEGVWGGMTEDERRTAYDSERAAARRAAAREAVAA